jgi:hypothetical protein
MTENEDLIRADAAELPADVCAAARLWKALDGRTEFGEAPGDLVAAPIDSRCVVARRFEPDELFEQLAEPGLLRLAIRQEIRHRKDPPVSRRRPYNMRMARTLLPRCFVLSIAVATLSIPALAQTPAPFPRPGQQPATPRPSAPAAPPAIANPAPASNPAQPGEPSEAMLGVPLYPGTQFIASYDAGRGQRYYLFGAESDFLQIVGWYKTVLKQKGELIFEEPPVHMFEIGKFKEETMAFTPSVTVKDYTWAGSLGYLNPKRGGTPPRFKTVVQIVPNLPAAPR